MINKILPILVLPLGLSLLLLVAGLFFRRRLLIGLGIMVLGMFSMPVVSASLIRAVEGWASRVPVSSLHKVDAVVVLSGIVGQIKGAPLGEWNGGVDRFEGGIDLFKAGKAPVIVFTRGQVPWQPESIPEGELLAKRAMLIGVPEKAILLTAVAGNTADEAVAAARLLGVRSGARKKIILVTSAFHMRRAAMQFEKAGFQVERYPVDFQAGDNSEVTILDFLPDPGALALSSTALREMIGLIYYWAKP
ncbi:YdcF family protein [Chlorobium sp. BLA1]|uniref:YdcF family protein n=1 Tax=Candidatus Chlorobium masyuteum TaxID=2716876 RepID=UPI0014239D78|nr:YdcF family protein [Candidatus Chlorobium masyuteum]NHQ59171.1 YdcF family protein [Candidatus Chlorobium masyuteum]